MAVFGFSNGKLSSGDITPDSSTTLSGGQSMTTTDGDVTNSYRTDRTDDDDN